MTQTTTNTANASRGTADGEVSAAITAATSAVATPIAARSRGPVRRGNDSTRRPTSDGLQPDGGTHCSGLHEAPRSMFFAAVKPKHNLEIPHSRVGRTEREHSSFSRSAALGNCQVPGISRNAQIGRIFSAYGSAIFTPAGTSGSVYRSGRNASEMRLMVEQAILRDLTAIGSE